MAVIRPTNETDYALKIGGLAQDKLSVLSFSGSEGISHLSSFSLDLASTDSKIDFAAVVGQPALLTLKMSVGQRYLVKSFF